MAQITGIMAFLVFLFSMGTDTKEQYYKLFGMASLVFALHYYLMGEMGITVLSLFATIRTLSFATKKGYAYRLPIGLVCMVCAATAALYFEQTIWTYLFCLSMCLTVLSEIAAKIVFIRINHVSQRILYLTYYILIGSIGGIMAEVCCLINLGRKLTENIRIKPVIAPHKAQL